jgi:hypothetical protein
MPSLRPVRLSTSHGGADLQENEEFERVTEAISARIHHCHHISLRFNQKATIDRLNASSGNLHSSAQQEHDDNDKRKGERCPKGATCERIVLGERLGKRTAP